MAFIFGLDFRPTQSSAPQVEKKICRQQMSMVSLLIFLIALGAFTLSSRGLIAALTENVVLQKFVQPYSVRALKMGKSYKVGAWLVLTLFLFASTVQSFLVVFFSL
jgi:VIT1/CCC1 family predicted Fe2+/Mn2+ transporter